MSNIPNYDQEIEKRYHPENFEESSECKHTSVHVGWSHTDRIIWCNQCREEITEEEAEEGEKYAKENTQ